MTCCTTFFVKLSLVLFLSLGAWNTLNNLEENSEVFMQSFKTFQSTFTSKTGVKFHDTLDHSKVDPIKEDVVKYTAYAIIGLGILSLLSSSCFTLLMALVYFLHESIRLNLFSFNQNTNLNQIQELALALFIVFVSFQVACSGCKTQCNRKKSVSEDRKKR